jgi:hypothetical protein
MIQPKIQEVLTHEQPNDNYVIVHLEESKLYLQKACTFTPEEFETFKREFGKELLEKAADNAYVDNNHQQGCSWDSDDFEVNKESIKSVLDEYLLNNKI